MHAMPGPGIPRISRLEGPDISGDAKKFVSRDMRTRRDDMKAKERGREYQKVRYKMELQGTRGHIYIATLFPRLEESITFNYKIEILSK